VARSDEQNRLGRERTRENILQAATAYAIPLQRAVLAMQQQPSTHRLFAESEARHEAGATAAEDAVRDLFRARGAECLDEQLPG